ncbi:hypothetical protein Taro_014617 [Colocasia esculenta]|uniref:ABC transporter domain-containing protein n=1 Tax=Colocasia esculenta TaxID=4460 RepID=A0A843U9H8_COLES|nr:hypothetical protein [Colocasia esculenta]
MGVGIGVGTCGGLNRRDTAGYNSSRIVTGCTGGGDGGVDRGDSVASPLETWRSSGAETARWPVLGCLGDCELEQEPPDLLAGWLKPRTRGTRAIVEVMEFLRLRPSKKRPVRILDDMTGILRPSRMTLVLGHPGSGKSTILRALAGKLNPSLKASGNITYNGQDLSNFVPQRTCAYVSQHDLHHAEMTPYCLSHAAGEMLVGLARCFFMDDISTGLDSSTTFEIVKFLGQMTHSMGLTMAISLLQPSPETFDLFDDVILICEGKIIYLGPCKNVLGFFDSMGFKCPERKNTADFLQEVTSKIDQAQYWAGSQSTYEFVSAETFAESFNSMYHRQFPDENKKENDQSSQDILITEKENGISRWEHFRACFSRELLLMKRNSPVHIFKNIQIALLGFIIMTVFFRTQMKHQSVADGNHFMGAIFAAVVIIMFNGMMELSMTLRRLPTFYKQRELLFLPGWAILTSIVLLSIPMSLLETALWTGLTYFVVGFAPSAVRFFQQYLALFLVHQMSMAIFRFISVVGRTQVMSNTLGAAALIAIYILGGFVISKDDIPRWLDWGYWVTPMTYGQNAVAINEFLDERWSMEMQERGAKERRLQLLHDVSGAFRPGVLTAMMGVTGAGKTTLLDVLAGRKTGGYIEGNISISGYPKRQDTYARIIGYCEQSDIRSPFLTVYESLQFSAWLRLPRNIQAPTRNVDRVMNLVELKPLKNAMVGLPGINGLAAGQRKCLTIAVELVASPSVVFMDEPTTGLDARAAAIVMQTVRKTVDTGRTVVCTIHQPSIEILEAFDELRTTRSAKIVDPEKVFPKLTLGWSRLLDLRPIEPISHVIYGRYEHTTLLLLKRGQLIYGGPMGRLSKDMVQYFEVTCTFLSEERIQYINMSYWKNPEHNICRFVTTVATSLLFGAVFWGAGSRITSEQDVFNILGAMYGFALFLGFTNASMVQPVVIMERIVFHRERSSGMYSSMPYACSQVIVEIPYVTVQVLILSAIAYTMIGFQFTVAKLFWFMFFMLMNFIYFSLFGMMMVALTPTLEIAAAFSFFIFFLWNFFSGFFIPRMMLPIWWRWYYWASPAAWTVYGLMVSQLGDQHGLISVPGKSDQSVKEFLEDYLGLQDKYFSLVVLLHLGICLLFLLTFIISIRELNFQRR